MDVGRGSDSDNDSAQRLQILRLVNRLIMTNVQVMSQFVTSLNRTASEVMRTVYDREPFPTSAVDFVTPGRRVRRAAHYMAAMGLWRPTSAPVFAGPISVSSCNSCMACEDCFPDGGQ